MQIKCSKKHTKLLIALRQGKTVRTGASQEGGLYIFIMLEKVPRVHFMIPNIY